ncbi:alpha,alpha-trehalase [Alteromonas sp. DY56-G5]|jgi:alpha,alpha-trehalase|uniref:trehalase family glycosidase n=1 Tax=Alteromonas TaxID=226 RepID=UPI001283BAE7|nr:trehalase family glycosidase [Alteromonas macleodii]MDM7964222.1 trehalase family glycosidase [Alteromonas macleodii]MDM8172651.1 trehalase family glycosidase [Alteromonas macleodii]CAI3928397.1 alpha [Alteromonas macleodii]VTP51894.1 alpha [Alteromonas macleodii]
MSSSSHNWRDSLSFFASDLFKHVQMAQLFPDSKTFADAIVKTDLNTVLAAYEQACLDAEKSGEAVDLATFVNTHFDTPEMISATSQTKFENVADYIEHMWQVLTRTPDTEQKDSLIALTRPYIVPGGRFREIYYWDTYFTALGLIDAGRTDMAINMLVNFVDILNEVGCIPNGNRAYYYSRSQPPILALFYNLLKDALSDQQKEYVIWGLKKEYQFWMNEAGENASQKGAAQLRTVTMPCGATLNRYFDTEPTPRPESYREDIETAEHIGADKSQFYQHVRAACESGWDFSSRWLANPNSLASIRTTEIIPVDLNALLVTLEQTLASVTKGAEQARYSAASTARINAINTYLFNAEKAGYFDYHFPTQTQTDVVSAAMCVPLFVGIANEQQAEGVRAAVMNSLLKEGGVVTTSNATSQQWDAPNGWAPLQLFAVEGLRNYGFEMQAQTIMLRFCKTIERHFASSGVLLEKYNVCEPEIKAGGGEYDVQLGFGWTNGVYTRFQTYLNQ